MKEGSVFAVVIGRAVHLPEITLVPVSEYKLRLKDSGFDLMLRGLSGEKDDLAPPIFWNLKRNGDFPWESGWVPFGDENRQRDIRKETRLLTVVDTSNPEIIIKCARSIYFLAELNGYDRGRHQLGEELIEKNGRTDPMG